MASSSKQLRVLNVFYGEETYLLDRELQRALKWPDRIVISLDGEQKLTEARVVSALEDLPLDEAQGTIVVVDNAEKVKLEGRLAAYLDKTKDTSTLLVAVCRVSKLPKPWAELATKGRVEEHARYKVWESDKIKKRLGREADRLALVADDLALDTLISAYGEDTGSMVNEMRKASLLLNKGATITRDIVLSLCPRRFAVAPWDVSGAAFAKDAKKALRSSSMLFEDRGDEALVPLVAALMRQLDQTLKIRSLLDQQKSLEVIASAVGLHPYRLKMELPLVRKHSKERLLQLMQELCKLEVDVKGAAPAKRTRVEQVVLAIAA